MTTTRRRIGTDGRLTVPATLRRQLGLKPGDTIVMGVEGGELRIRTMRDVIRRAQALVRRYNRSGEWLSNSLIRERRAEARRDR